MSTRTIRILVVAVVVLFAAVWLLNRERSADTTTDELLFSGLKDRLDEVTEVRIVDGDGEIRILREDDRWIVPDKGGYPADTVALRELLLGIAEAHKIEQKTANSELYDRLGVQDPQEDGASGVLVQSTGLGDADFALILGDPVQGDYRYVRLADEATSWLVDRNPQVPDDAGGWLASDIIDIDASRVQAVTIRHADGELIRISKDSKDDPNFTVQEIPAGRNVSYLSVANGIGAALDNLALEDVRPADAGAGSGGDGAATTVFTTFDGLEITVESTGEDEESWIGLHAAALPQSQSEGGSKPAEDGGASAEAEPADAGAEPEDGEPAQGEPAEEAAAAVDPAAAAADINARVAGWEYRVPQYKASQLRRRWEDLLSDDDAEE